MAYISQDSILKLRGKLGDKIYKEINGKIYITNAPEKIKIPNDAAAILRKERFAVCHKLSSAIKKLPAVHLLWKYNLHSKNVSTRMFQHIYSSLKGTSIERVSLIPCHLFNAGLVSFSFNAGLISASFETLSAAESIWPSVDIQMYLFGVIMLSYEEELIKNRFEFWPINSVGMKTNVSQEMIFEVQLSPIQLESINKSKSSVLLMNLVTSDNRGVPQKYSDTFYQVLK